MEWNDRRMNTCCYYIWRNGENDVNNDKQKATKSMTKLKANKYKQRSFKKECYFHEQEKKINKSIHSKLLQCIIMRNYRIIKFTMLFTYVGHKKK